MSVTAQTGQSIGLADINVANDEIIMVTSLADIGTYKMQRG